MIILRKKEKSLPEKLLDIDVLNLKTEPYEWKENVITSAGILLPLTTFIATVVTCGPVISAAVTALSILPSMLITTVAQDKADDKHMDKIYIANELYQDKTKGEINELEKTVIKLSEKQLGFKEGEMPQDEVFAKANKLRELKIRRDARDISKATYQSEFEKLK